MYSLKQAALAAVLVDAFGVDKKAKPAAAVILWCAPRLTAPGLRRCGCLDRAPVVRSPTRSSQPGRNGRF
jgi:hypothetical protein